MRSFLNIAGSIVILAFVGGQGGFASETPASPAKSSQNKEQGPGKTPGKKSKGDQRKDAKDSKDGKEPEKKRGKNDEKPVDDSEDEAIPLPIPIGHDSKGLTIPYLVGGRKQMEFHIGIGRRLDDKQVEMEVLRVDAFDDAGALEMQIDLPKSILDLNSRVISTQSTVHIRRKDLEITGQTMKFDTRTRVGSIDGNVRMYIFDLESQTSATAPSTSDSQPKAEVPAKAKTNPQSKNKAKP